MSEKNSIPSFKKLRLGAMQRLIAMIILIVIQIVLIIIMFSYFREKFAYFTAVCTALSLVAAIHIVRKDTTPEYKLAWIVPILLLPIFGGLLYLFYGRNYPTNKEIRNTQTAIERTRAALAMFPDETKEQAIAERLKRENTDAYLQSSYLRRAAEAPLYTGTRTRYFSPGEKMFTQMLADLRSAKKNIFLEYFIIDHGHMWSSILEILLQKAAEGVDVRLLYDDFGCMTSLPPDYP